VESADVEIIADADPGRPYTSLGSIRVRIATGYVTNNSRNVESVNAKLRKVAFRKKANAVIGVQYERGRFLGTWKTLTVTGTAVVADTADRECPACGKPIKWDATVCRFCGHAVERVKPLPEPTDRSEGWQPDPSGRHPERYYDGLQWTVWVREEPGAPRAEDPPWI